MRCITLTAALVLCVWVAMAGQATAQASAVQSVTRMYSDTQGETHIETVMMDVGRSSGFSPTGTVYFSRFAADMNLDWHPAPRRQFLIRLSGPGYEIETSDGSVAHLPPGSVLLVEDTNPAHRGHKTRSLGGETLVMHRPDRLSCHDGGPSAENRARTVARGRWCVKAQMARVQQTPSDPV